MTVPLVHGADIDGDDTQTPEHRARVDAIAARTAAVRHFRRAVDADLRAGTRSHEAIAVACDLLGQMIVEIAIRPTDAALADAIAATMTRLVEGASRAWLRTARTSPGAWANRPGATAPEQPPVGADILPPPQGGESLIRPAAALLEDAIDTVARAAIATAIESGEPHVDREGLLIHVRWRVAEIEAERRQADRGVDPTAARPPASASLPPPAS